MTKVKRKALSDCKLDEVITSVSSISLHCGDPNLHNSTEVKTLVRQVVVWAISINKSRSAFKENGHTLIFEEGLRAAFGDSFKWLLGLVKPKFTITHFGMHDINGLLIGSGTLFKPIRFQHGDLVIFKPGSIQVVS